MGDAGRCDTLNDDRTAALAETIPGTLVTLGDSVYSDGTTKEFADCYGPGWGRLLERTRPAPGNHEYHIAGAAGYFDYFGDRAGPAGRGWYSFDLGTWHLLSLDSECYAIGGCGPDSPQGRWIAEDLAARVVACTLAYWHRPVFSTGQHGDQRDVAPLWQALQDAGADVVLSGHDHDYERFVRQDAAGRPDPGGMTEFVVGTGGAPLRAFLLPHDTSAFRDAGHYGVLVLTLRPGAFDWRFLSVPDGAPLDSGSEACH